MRPRLLPVLCFVFFCVGAASLQAQVIVWSGAGNRFITGTNWVGGVAPGPTDTAQFGNHGGNTTIMVNSTTINHLEFLSTRTAIHNFSYDDGTAVMTLNGNFTAATGPAVNFFINGFNQLNLALPDGEHVFNIGASTTVTIASLITGTGHLSKIGAGTLVLGGANTLNYNGVGGFNNGVAVDGGTLELNGGSITQSFQDIIVGSVSGGTGTLLVTNGGDVVTKYGVAGNDVSTNATITVTGTGSTWTNSQGMALGYLGTGFLNVLAGGTVNTTGSGTDHSYLGLQSGTAGTAVVSGAGSAWTTPNDQLIIGGGGTGNLTISSGGLVSNTLGYIGQSALGSGTVSVNNGTWNNSAELLVGQSGTGTLSVTNGGDVTNTFSYIATQSGSNGTVTVDGTGSTWTNSGLMAVGQGGTGSLTISNGGVVSNTQGYAGYTAGSNGTVSVTGTGSTWTNSSNLSIGQAGTGTLSVLAGGSVTNVTGRIGDGSGSTGSATVSGAGSSWTNSAQLFVGNSGAGTLLVQSGGTVTANNGSIAFNSGSTGQVTVTGAGSTFTNTTSLFVGGSGTASLTAANAGVVNVNAGSGTLTLASTAGSGTLNLGAAAASAAAAGGIINAATITSGTGAGTVQFNTTATSGTPYYLTKDGTSGGTAVVVAGTTSLINTAGYNVLGGANTYTGVTTINGGTLVASNLAGSSLPSSIGASSNAAANLVLDGGTLLYTGGNQNSNRLFTLGVNGGTLDMSNATVAGGFTFTNSGSIALAGTNTARTLNLAGGANHSFGVYFTPLLGDNGTGATSVVAKGGSFWNLESANTYSGGTTIENGGLLVANNTSGSATGTGNVTVNNGGRLRFGSNTATGAISGNIVTNGTGSVEFNRSTAYTYAGVISGTGTVAHMGTAGAITLTGTNTYTGGTKINGGTLLVSGTGSINHGAADTVVAFSNGEVADLFINTGGDVTNGQGQIGFSAGSDGAVTVSGPGSTWTNTNYLYVGLAGYGYLDIASGGQVTSPNTSIGNNIGGEGEVILNGVGSTLTNTDTLYVGSQGLGYLDITNGALVTNVTGSIGNNVGGEGYAYLDIGGTWNNSGSLLIGNASDGYLDVYGASTVTALNATAGYLSGSYGAVYVSGAGSTLSTTGNLIVGGSGEGDLNVVNGADVITGGSSGIIANTTGSLGHVVIDGAGSTWTIAGSGLYVGNNGPGEAYLYNSSLLTVGSGSGTVYLGTNPGSSGQFYFGNLNVGSGVDAGILNAASITTGGGTGKVFFESTNATKNAPFYLTKDGTAGGAAITITGGTQVQNTTGYTVLTGANTYSGGTIITGGTLVAGATGALGTGTVQVNGGSLYVAPGTTLANALAFAANGGALGGTGTFGSTLTVGPNARLAPGNSVGTLNFAGGLTLAGGGALDFEVQVANGAPGTGYDLVSISGGPLNITATSATPFTLKIISLDAGGLPGAVSDFSASSPYAWTFATSAAGITGFDATAFTFNTGAFTNNLGIGNFFVTQSGNNLVLNFTPVPEPSTYALMLAGLGLAGFRRWRKRHA